jgi:D-glycero-D-manno-heptose 1,7-bisphosphate phosphatase
MSWPHEKLDEPDERVLAKESDAPGFWLAFRRCCAVMDSSTVFLDRDGVINRLRSNYVTSWDEFEFLPHAKDAIRLLNEAGMRVVVVTNQRAIARGLLSVEELMSIHANMCAELALAGATIDAIYYCPHDKGVCACRKPGVEMFLQAQRTFPDIDLSRSVVVGDSLSDMQAGSRLGCRLILVTDTGCSDRSHESSSAVQAIQTAEIPLDWRARALYDAVVDYILAPSRDGTVQPL